MNPECPWTVYRTRFLVRARQLTEPLVFIDALGREQSGVPGDYLVESSDGISRIHSRAIFEDIYVPLVTSQHRNPYRDNESPGVLARPVSRARPEHRQRALA